MSMLLEWSAAGGFPIYRRCCYIMGQALLVSAVQCGKQGQKLALGLSSTLYYTNVQTRIRSHTSCVEMCRGFLFT